MSTRTLVVLSVLGLAAVAAVVAGIGAPGGGPTVDAVPARLGPIREFIDEEGKTRLPRTYPIAMPYEGRIAPITLEEGDRVEAGRVVARLVPEDLEIRVAEATAAVERLDAAIEEAGDATVEEALIGQVEEFLLSVDRTVEAADEQVKAGEAVLGFAEKTLRRRRELSRRDAASEEELNRAETEQAQAAVEYRKDVLTTAALRSMQAAFSLTPNIIRRYIDTKGLRVAVLRRERAEAASRLEQVLLNRDRGTLTSPVDGVVLSREVAGERLLPAGEILMEIGDLETLEVEAELLTQEAIRVAPGQPVELRGLSPDGEVVPGTVRRVNPSGFTKLSSLGVEQQRVTVVVAIDPEALAELLEAGRVGVGYRVDVRIRTAERSKALVVPRSALFRGTDGRWEVFAVREGRIERRGVAVGLMNDEWAEVQEGLEEGDLVIPAPEADLEPGMRVRPVVAPDLAAAGG
ncbi:efflux RND transporter periplasmic adaptor subunit [Tautonia sociabilis]|uniref:Efflux RND transporter periplasmic adaptor subunit n=1 Tax=Tautonia sociabilis TaxID=2080755 RepID=A0A432MGA6_9BACT|nr:efflux RND transporter periplasmic adaptor subunit [Tautonia sociabilis]RUL85545.1 efflux RND transporter periplasmic adaptor subunit [Tautonia sociabilis]